MTKCDSAICLDGILGCVKDISGKTNEIQIKPGILFK